jgi:Acetyltransferase (GNAT) domain
MLDGGALETRPGRCSVRLRDVEPVDVGAYVRMRCDPVMMAELGGPVPREGVAAKVARDVEQAAADAAWIKMIIPDESVPGVVAGSVTLWSHEDAGTAMSEIGWMVLPEFQGRGIATTAVRMLLALARAGSLGAGARVPGDHEYPFQRRLPVGRIQIRRRTGDHLRRARVPHESLGDQSRHRPNMLTLKLRRWHDSAPASADENRRGAFERSWSMRCCPRRPGVIALWPGGGPSIPRVHVSAAAVYPSVVTMPNEACPSVLQAVVWRYSSVGP